jgi:hypothetical protein
MLVALQVRDGRGSWGRNLLQMALLLCVVIALPPSEKVPSSFWQPPLVVLQSGTMRTATTLQYATIIAAMAIKFENQPDVELADGFNVRARAGCCVCRARAGAGTLVLSLASRLVSKARHSWQQLYHVPQGTDKQVPSL